MLLKSKLKSHNKYDWKEKLNRIFFVFMNYIHTYNLWITYYVWHIHVVNFPPQVLLTKIKDFGKKSKEQLEKDEDQTQAFILSLSIQCWITIYPLFSCCLLSALRLWAQLWLPEQQHFPCSGQLRVDRTSRAFSSINHREVCPEPCHDSPAEFCRVLLISCLLKAVPSDLVCIHCSDALTFYSSPVLQARLLCTKAYGHSSQFLRSLKLVELLSHT